MTLEQQVTNLELSKKLKELGVEQKSIWMWLRNIHTDKKMFLTLADNFNGTFESEYENGVHYENYSAFTASELGEILPDFIKNIETRNLDSLVFRKTHEDWIAEYHTTFSPPLYSIRDKSEADARAKMVIYLIKNSLITL